MPPLRRQRSNRRTEKEDANALPTLDVKYDTEAISQLLGNLSLAMEAKCAQITNDTEFMIISMQQMFHLELIKLPTQVKQMSVKRFHDEFGCSLEAVTRGTISGIAAANNANTSAKSKTDGDKIDRNTSRQSIYQTPHHGQGKKALLPMQHTAMRMPREGETILSTNGSPLGEFVTAKKAPRVGPTIIPPTPGLMVQTQSGDIVGLDEIDIENMTSESKLETFQQMQAMMDNMKAMMEKLQSQL